jgi:hypothetical protein
MTVVLVGRSLQLHPLHIDPNNQSDELQLDPPTALLEFQLEMLALCAIKRAE